MNKKELLKSKYLGKSVFSYHGNTEVINSNTREFVSLENINKLSKRKTLYFFNDIRDAVKI